MFNAFVVFTFDQSIATNNLKIMKTIISFIIMLNILFSAQSQILNGQEKGQKLLDNAIANGQFAGVSGGTISNGIITWTGGAGYANVEDKTAFTPQSVSRIASIAKPMTAIAIMQLVERGHIQLDDKVNLYIPAFTKVELQTITIRHILQHSSGLGAYQSNKERNSYTNYATLEEALQVFIHRELEFTPGNDFGYTTYGYVVLGMIIEKVTGVSYEDFLKKNIWEVADMQHTSVEKFGIAVENKTKMYHQKKPGKIKTVKQTNLSDRIPGGGVQSTVEDLLKFGNAVLDGSLIKKETLEQMIIDTGLKKEGNGYGMGWYLYGENPTHGNVFGHNGGQLGSISVLLLLPEQNSAVSVLSSTSGGMQEIFRIAIDLFDVAASLKQTP